MPRQRIPQRMGTPGVQVDLMLRAVRPEQTVLSASLLGLDHKGAGRQDEASDSDPLTLAEYVTHCPKISVR
jgi:hypothetical protein